MSKKILVLGATGRTGLLIIKHALARGWSVNALVRNPDALSTNDSKLTVYKGTPLNASDVETAIEGCDAVISALNNNRSSDSPFAKPISPENFMIDSITNTIAAMKAKGIKRITVLSADGVADSFEYTAWFLRMMIKHTNLGIAYRDHDKVDAALRESGLDWTSVRPTMLGKKTGKQPIVESYNNLPKSSMQISRESVANYLLDSLDNPELIGKAPTISQR